LIFPERPSVQSLLAEYLFANDKSDRFFRVMKFWMDEKSGIALTLETGIPS
jgi:hypothetical protein